MKNSVIDMTYLQDISDGDPKEMQKFTHLYIRNMTTQLKKLERAIRRGKCADVEQISHSAAGSSAVLGMRAMASLLKEMEKMATSGNLLGSRDALSKIQTTFSQTTHYLNSQSLPDPE